MVSSLHIHRFERARARDYDVPMGDSSNRATTETTQPTVPHVEVCPACGGPLHGRSCKVYCVTSSCELYGRIIENCAGD